MGCQCLALEVMPLMRFHNFHQEWCMVAYYGCFGVNYSFRRLQSRRRSSGQVDDAVENWIFVIFPKRNCFKWNAVLVTSIFNHFNFHTTQVFFTSCIYYPLHWNLTPSKITIMQDVSHVQAWFAAINTLPHSTQLFFTTSPYYLLYCNLKISLLPIIRVILPVPPSSYISQHNFDCSTSSAVR